MAKKSSAKKESVKNVTASIDKYLADDFFMEWWSSESRKSLHELGIKGIINTFQEFNRIYSYILENYSKPVDTAIRVSNMIHVLPQVIWYDFYNQLESKLYQEKHLEKPQIKYIIGEINHYSVHSPHNSMHSYKEMLKMVEEEFVLIRYNKLEMLKVIADLKTFSEKRDYVQKALNLLHDNYLIWPALKSEEYNLVEWESDCKEMLNNINQEEKKLLQNLQNIDFSFFNRIIKGDFHPENFKNASELRKYTDVFNVSFPSGRNSNSHIHEDEIPSPFNHLCRYYSFAIKVESDKIKDLANQFLTLSKEPEQIKLFTLKHIQLLKNLSKEAHTQFNMQCKGDHNAYLLDSNAWVFYALRVYLLRLILYFQDTFKPFYDFPVDSESSLKYELYEINNSPELEKIINEHKIDNFKDSVNYINKGLFQVEMFMSGKSKTIDYFDMEYGFDKFIKGIAKFENYTPENRLLFKKYKMLVHFLCEQYAKCLIPEKVDKHKNSFVSMMKELRQVNTDIDSLVFSENGDTIPKPIHSILEIINERNKTSPKQDSPTDQNLSFGFKNKNAANFRDVITMLCNEIDMLNSDKSSITDFINVLLSKNLQDGHRPIHLNCKTNLFAYIIRNIDRYFHSLTPAIIEKSGLFYSSNGNPIKAQNLYSNKTDTPNKKKEVDDILKQLQ